MAAEHTLEAAFPWGLLVVSDSASSRQIEDGGSISMLCADDIVVVKVQHEQEGETTVRIWFDVVGDPTSATMLLGRCAIRVSSGRLIVGDVMQDVALEVRVSPGVYDISVLGDAEQWPEEVDLVLTRGGSGHRDMNGV